MINIRVIGNGTVSVSKPIGQNKGPVTGPSMIITPMTKVTILISGEKIDHSIIYVGTNAFCLKKSFTSCHT